MKKKLKAVSRINGKGSTTAYSALMMFSFLHACISLKFQLAGFGKSDTITKAVDTLRSDRGRQGSASDGAESSAGQVRSGELESMQS